MPQPVSSGMMPPFETTLARTGRIEGLNPCWEEVLHLATRREFEKDAVIPHTRWRGMYYLSRGAVALSYIAASGRERLTLRVGPGCLFNEARTVSSFEPGVVFQCLEPTEIWRFPEGLLQDEAFLSAHPRQVASLLHSMGIKILIHYTFLADMGTGSRESHVCRFILNLSRQNGNALCFPYPAATSGKGHHRRVFLQGGHHPRCPTAGRAGPEQLGYFQFETLCVSNHTA